LIGLAVAALGFPARGEETVRATQVPTVGTPSLLLWVTAGLLVVAGIAVLVLPPFLLGRVHHVPTTGHPPGPPVAASRTSPPEQQIDVGVTPADLFGFFSGNTDVQADALLAPFLGKWITISGHLQTLRKSGSDYQVILDEHFFPKTTNNVLFHFGDQWGPQLEVLKIGAELTVRGRIESLSQAFLTVEGCELR
jgi:hypothetical protein